VRWEVRRSEEERRSESVLTEVNLNEQGSYRLEKYKDIWMQWEPVCTYKGVTALMLAIIKGMPGMVEKLLAAGAKAETTNEVKERETCTRARWKTPFQQSLPMCICAGWGLLLLRLQSGHFRRQHEPDAGHQEVRRRQR
jgi:hypothetical protein